MRLHATTKPRKNYYKFINICRNAIRLADETKNLAEQYNFEVKGYRFEAKKEDLRKPRIVRVRSDVIPNPNLPSFIL